MVTCLEEFVACSVIRAMNSEDPLLERVTRYQEQTMYIGQEMRLILKVKNEMICLYSIL